MAELKEGLVGGAVNLYFIYKFLRILTTPWENTDAYKLGIIDEKGTILRKKRTLLKIEEKEAYTMMHRLVWKLKRLMEKVPFGKSRLASYAAALWLIKEDKNFHGNDKELQESFLSFLETNWKDKALILKENYEGDMDKKTYSNLKEGIDIKKASMGDVIKDFQKSDAPQFKGKSDKKKKEMAVAAKLSKEEVEIDERYYFNIGRGIYYMSPDSHKIDHKKEVKDGYPNAKEVLSSIKQASDYVAKKNNIKEAVLADRDYKYDGKVVKISKKNFSKVHKDFKNSTKGKERMMINDPKTGGSISVPVQFEEVEVDEKPAHKFKLKQFKHLKPKKKKKEHGSYGRFSDTSGGFAFMKSKGGSGYVGAYNSAELDGEYKLKEEFSEKDFDSLKRGDTITIEFKSPMSAGKGTFKVTAKNIVGKAKVHKATLQNVKNPKSVKFFLYKRGNKVSLAQGDMAASVVKYTIEGVELDEATVLSITDVDQWTHEIYKGIKAGWKSVGKSTLGGDENVAIMIKVTVEPEKDWPNKILHNAKFGLISIGTDGTMKMFASGHKIKNMRQTRVRSAKDVVKKINDWIKKVDEGIIEFSSFTNYLAEGRPKLDPDHVPGATKLDYAKGALVSQQKRLYSVKDIEGLARKYKIRLDGAPAGGREWDGDWEIAVRGGIILSYEYQGNTMSVKGWKWDNKKIKDYINKWEPAHSTPRDMKPMGGKILLRGFETAFALIGEGFVSEELKEEFWAVIDKAKGGEVMAVSSDEKGARDSVKFSTTSKYDYHYGKDPKTLKVVKVKGKHSDKKAQKMIGTKLSFKEEAPANSVASGNVNLDPHKKKKRKNAKVNYEDFGGARVYVVSNERWHSSRLGKSRYARYEKYVGNDKLGETIRQYGRSNPKSPIILKNEENGAMLYLKYGKKR